MKTRWLTHVLALAAGFGIAFAVRAARSGDPSAPQEQRSPRTAGRSAGTQSFQEMFDRRLAAARLKVSAESGDPIARLAQQQSDLSACRERAALWERLSHRYDGVSKLDPPLTAALQAGDNAEAAAVFLAWHRRDAGAALTALAVRHGAWPELLADPAFAASLEDRELSALYRGEGHFSEEFLKAVALGHGGWLGLQGDIEGWKRSLPPGSPDLKVRFAVGFLKQWVPENAGQFSHFLLQEMAPEIRPGLLAGSGLNRTLEWAVSEVLEGRDIGTLFEGGESSHSREKPSDAWGGGKDYQALYAFGEMSAEDIRADLEQFTKGEFSPEDLDVSVMQCLLPTDSRAAVAWASARGVSPELQVEAAEMVKWGKAGLSGREAAALLEGASRIEGWPGRFESAGLFFSMDRWGGEDECEPLRFWELVNPVAAAPVIESLPEKWKEARAAK